jgi:hypothetical protein
MIGFTMAAESFVYYAFMFLASISFYTIFGQFMVYVTPSQQIAQVRHVRRGGGGVTRRHVCRGVTRAATYNCVFQLCKMH